jgi:hypothetical protein
MYPKCGICVARGAGSDSLLAGVSGCHIFVPAPHALPPQGIGRKSSFCPPLLQRHQGEYIKFVFLTSQSIHLLNYYFEFLDFKGNRSVDRNRFSKYMQCLQKSLWPIGIKLIDVKIVTNFRKIIELQNFALFSGSRLSEVGFGKTRMQAMKMHPSFFSN